MQGPERLADGPGVAGGPTCLAPLRPLLSAALVTPRNRGAYAAAWQLVQALTAARSDSDALLLALLEDGTLEAALRASHWHEAAAAAGPPPAAPLEVRLSPAP